jgi:hypothetical protein
MPAVQSKPRADAPSRADVEGEIEQFRQLVIAARSSASVADQAGRSMARLNALHSTAPDLFSTEDARWLNVLCGFLGVRLAAHQPAGEHSYKTKRKGDTLDHCWRCETRVDERFTETCVACSGRAYQWLACPVCRACGCQRTGRVLV